MTQPNDCRFPATVGWLAVVLFLIVFAMGASKPLLLDNMEFPAMAEATAQTGLPVYYKGEQNPQCLGLYHPPLYIYLLAAWFKALGSAPAQARLFGAVCALAHGACVLLLVRQLFGRAYARSIAPWFWVLFLLNAYTIQAASIADIDPTIYGPLILLFLWTVLRLSWRNGELRQDRIAPVEMLGATLALTACLWAKLTTIWLVLPFVFLMLIRRLGLAGAAKATAMLFVAGVSTFLATYWIYGWLTNLDVGYTFAFTWMSFRVRGASGGSGLSAWFADRWHNFRLMAPFMVSWTGLAPWLACLTSAGWAAWQGWRHKEYRLRHATLVLLLALGSIAYYCAQVQSFGAAPFKYTLVYWGLAVAAVVMVVLPPGRSNEFPPSCHAAAWLGMWAAAAVFSLRFIKDRTLTAMYGPEAIIWPWMVPAAVFCLGLSLLWRGRTAGRAVLAASLALCGGVEMGMAVSQNAREYATTYDYGESGFADVVGYVRSHTDSGEVIVSMKDVGYAAKRKYFENYAAVYGNPEEMARMRELLRSGRARLVIFTVAHGQDQLMVVNPPLRDWVVQNCRPVAASGDYRIFEYSGDSAAQLAPPGQAAAR